MEPVKIVVVGSLNVDLVVRTPRVPEDGETIVGTEFNRFFGGKGANQAVAARRQGAETIMAGRVGSDLFGQDQVRSLK
ncbi:MAG: PfkB family carbohydrate kinase, partial [Limnochordia bacterium]